jgi:hypothetical protein
MRSLPSGHGRYSHLKDEWAVYFPGIATDDTTKYFFQDVVEKKSLISFFDFENKLLLFSDVAPVVKFCLFVAGSRTQAAVDETLFIFFAHQVSDLQDSDRVFKLSAEDFYLLNPNTRTCPIFRSSRDAELTKAIHRRVPILLRDGVIKENAWAISLKQGLFNMTTGSQHFRTREQLELEGGYLNGNVFQCGTGDYLPLYEAKLFHQFNHRPSTFDGIPVTDRFKMKAPTIASNVIQLENPEYSILPRFWLARSLVDDACNLLGPSHFLVVFRRVTNVMTNSRNAAFAVLPRVGVSDSVQICSFERTELVCPFLAAANSIVFDYATRQKLAGGNMSIFIVNQLPIPLPSQFMQTAGWLEPTLVLTNWLLPRVLELTYTSWDLQQFARDCCWGGPPFRWDEERRFLLRCELDAIFFHLYLPTEQSGEWRPAKGETLEDLARLMQSFPTPRDAVTYIMDTFPIVRRRDEEKYNGDYRTKRVILEIYNALQDAIRTGRPYQTSLDPPPGPPIDANGKFVSYAEIAANPPPHIHLPREHANTGVELHLSDLARGFPNSAFNVRLGTQASSGRVRVTPVPTTDLRVGENVILAAPALRLHGEAVPAAIGKLGIESRSDAASGDHYVLASVRGDRGVAQARLSEAEWKNLTSIGRVENLD